MNRKLFLCAALLVFCLAAFYASTHAGSPQADASARAMNQPVKPFHIIGNIYYVGASDVTSFLIVTPAGDILLDGGFVETAPQIEANIRALGFHLRDVKILLNSHAHYDHAGGLSDIQRATGAKFYASAADAPSLAAGGRGDFYFGDSLPFSPVKPSRLLSDGDTVRIGGTVMTARVTPGHTKGCTTWTTTTEENDKPLHVVFVCSTSVLDGYHLVKNAAYPHIATDYEKTFRILRSLPCDVFLGSHGSFFALTAKRAAMLRGVKPNPFIDPAGYRSYLDRSEAAFREDLRRQLQQQKNSNATGAAQHGIRPLAETELSRYSFPR
ncbi:MAG TPA: subclass B3 metallo-beta-lactamase [Candidatus Acidoferrales bacterium]|nr:subclass B3 metallo-beta-lactamase [Candidatus Acidoferrales bacterium]